VDDIGGVSIKYEIVHNCVKNYVWRSERKTALGNQGIDEQVRWI
jgi:Arc/MetJ family transcription regulator